MEALTYKLEQFEGPLDLLLSLISKNKVNIEDIPISLICDQYMEYIRQAEQMDMELATEFLVVSGHILFVTPALSYASFINIPTIYAQLNTGSSRDGATFATPRLTR